MKTKPGTIEICVIYILLLFPVYGLFTPVEDYINQRVWSVTNGIEGSTYPVSQKLYLFFFISLCGFFLIYFSRFMRQLRSMLPLLLFVLWAMLGSLWSVDADMTVKRVVRMSEFIGFGAYLVLRFEFRDLLALLNRSIAVIVVASFAVLLIATPYAYTNLIGYENAIRGAVVTKNELGAIMSLGVIVSGCAWMEKVNHRYTRVIAFAGSVLLLVLSHSATSMIATLACAGFFTVYFAVKSGGNPAFRTLATLAILGGITVAINILISSDDFMSIIGRSSTLTGRTSVWDAVIRVIELRPWTGYGYGFWIPLSVPKLNIWNTVQFSVPHSHSDWIDIALQAGLVGVALLAWIWIIAGWRCMWFLSLGAEGALFCALLLVNLFVRGLTETTLVDPSVSSWTWFTMAYLLLAGMVRNRRAQLREQFGHPGLAII